MSQEIFQVDAFTDAPFKGNPAAVCVLPQEGDEGWMQNLATEMNLSETAFLVQQDDGYNLRWFTPAVEVDLCGHATLASAHILWETGLLAGDQQARFFTRSGLLTAERQGDWIQLNFPSEPASAACKHRKIWIRPWAYLRHMSAKTDLTIWWRWKRKISVRNMTPDYTVIKLDFQSGFYGHQ